jgi:hypothetical protein
VKLQAERKPCSWETKKEMAGADLMETEWTIVGLVLVVHDDDENLL